MAIIAFNYTKMLAEKSKPVRGKVNISNNVLVTEIEENETAFEKGKKAMRVGYKFYSNYEPEVAKIEIQGNLIYMDEGKKIDELLKKWEKDKKMPKNVMTDILNNVLSRCNIQALVMSKDLNLPTPFPLPKVSGESGEPGQKAKKK